MATPTPTIERIDFISHSGPEPRLFCSFFWSDALGVRCTNEWMMQEMETQGIGVPPDGATVYPRDGRKFFDALKHAGSSVVEVTPARVVTASEAS
jgi:hypothetical protein